MDAPTFDSSGYPTDETLRAIREWGTDLEAGIRFIQKAWYYPDRFVEVRPGVWYVSTGGWSGNEELIGAWKRNFILWTQWYVLARRGGHFIFARGEDGDDVCFCNLREEN